MISKGSVTDANKKFTSISNDYRLIFNNDSSIIECDSDKENNPTESKI